MVLDAAAATLAREPGSVDRLVRLAAADMAGVDALITARMQSEVPVIPALAEHLIAAGGKRLRPLLTVAAARLAGSDNDTCLKLAAAVEFIHTATLLHDDVVDGSQLRRGKVAINLDEGTGEDNADDVVALAEAVEDGDDARSPRRKSRGGVKPTGRSSRGVRGIKLARSEYVVSLIVAEPAVGQDEDAEDIEPAAEADAEADAESVVRNGDEADAYILTATENGYGKRTPLAEYPRKGRGTQGVIGIQTSGRNGKLVGAVLLSARDEVLLISDGGTLVRTRASEISRVGRNTQGVTLIRLSKGEKLQAVERLDGSLAEEEPIEPIAGEEGSIEVASELPPES